MSYIYTYQLSCILHFSLKSSILTVCYHNVLRYEDDSIIGHRLHREIRKVEVKGKGKNVPPIPHSSYQWEAVATNLDEFLNVSVSLFFSILHITWHLFKFKETLDAPIVLSVME